MAVSYISMKQHIHVSVSYLCPYSHPCFLGIIIKQSGCGIVDDTFLVTFWLEYLIYKEEGTPSLRLWMGEIYLVICFSSNWNCLGTLPSNIHYLLWSVKELNHHISLASCGLSWNITCLGCGLVFFRQLNKQSPIRKTKIAIHIFVTTNTNLQTKQRIFVSACAYFSFLYCHLLFF